MLIDDFKSPDGTARSGGQWEAVSDQVMGGISRATLNFTPGAMRLTGDVRLENNGGFVQAALEMKIDASQFTGIRITVSGPPETYALNFRTTDLDKPWQSYRSEFQTTPRPQPVELPFTEFEPNKTQNAFNPANIRRVGIIAVGRAFHADITIHQLEFY